MLPKVMLNIEIRMCWPDPDDVCLAGGCIHCPDATWVPLEEVHAYADRHRVATQGRHVVGSRWDGFRYGMTHWWWNYPKRKLNVRRARAWSGTPDDRQYAGWEEMQRAT